MTPLRHSPLHGILLVILATLLFAGMDTAGKYLMTKFNVPLVASIRYGLNVILLGAIFLPRHGTTLWKTNRTWLVLMRALSLVFSTFFSGLALLRLPVGEAIALFYLQIFGVMLAAAPILGERVPRLGWIATAVGFLGVLLIARPGGALDPLGLFYCFICAALSVVYVLLSRKLAKTESTMAMLFMVAIAGTVFFGTMLMFDRPVSNPTHFDLALLFFMGAAALTAHFAFTAAYRLAPASLLAPFSYLHIAFATLGGWLAYNHVPENYALVGMALIIAAGTALALDAHRSRGKEKSIAAEVLVREND